MHAITVFYVSSCSDKKFYRSRAHLIGAIFRGLFHIDLEIYQEKKLLTFWFIFHPQSFAGQEAGWLWCGMSPNLGFGTNTIFTIMLVILLSYNHHYHHYLPSYCPYFNHYYPHHHFTEIIVFSYSPSLSSEI